MLKRKDRYETSIAVFRKLGEIFKTSDAISAGIHPRTFYEMLAEGVIEKLSRGLYRLTELPPLGNPDLISVSKRIPNGVICLISALAFYEITTQIPHEVYIAVSRNSQVPRIDYPPVRIFRFSSSAFTEGIKLQKADGMFMRMYSPAKTVADCFKYRNKIGLDVAVEALKLYREIKLFSVDEMIYYARVCRVERVMRPYLEAVL